MQVISFAKEADLTFKELLALFFNGSKTFIVQAVNKILMTATI
jgi:hypothetical protein